MAPFCFFKEDWGDNAEWAAKYPFPGNGAAGAEAKEFKKYMEKIPRGTSGIKSSTPKARNARHCGIIAKSARTSVFAARTNRLSSREAGEAGEAGYPAVCKP